MNAEEFKQKVLPVNQKLFRLSFRFLGNVQEAEDAVQEVFLKLWSMRHKLIEVNNHLTQEIHDVIVKKGGAMNEKL